MATNHYALGAFRLHTGTVFKFRMLGSQIRAVFLPEASRKKLLFAFPSLSGYILALRPFPRLRSQQVASSDFSFPHLCILGHISQPCPCPAGLSLSLRKTLWLF